MKNKTGVRSCSDFIHACNELNNLQAYCLLRLILRPLSSLRDQTTLDDRCAHQGGKNTLSRVIHQELSNEQLIKKNKKKKTGE